MKKDTAHHFPSTSNTVANIDQRDLEKLADLVGALPAGVATVTPQERAEQLRRRQSGYDRRFAVD